MIVIKNTKYGLFLILATCLAFISILPQKVSAASPQCFTYNEQNSKYTSVDCATQPGVLSFQDDKCYATVASGTNVGGTEVNCATALANLETSTGNLTADCKDKNITQKNCGIVAYLVDFIKILSGLVGVVVVIMITVGGIQYSTARDNPQATAAAKGRIVNAVLALVLYLFVFAFLQYIVPGGIL